MTQQEGHRFIGHRVRFVDQYGKSRTGLVVGFEGGLLDIDFGMAGYDPNRTYYSRKPSSEVQDLGPAPAERKRQ